jgi:hypothetical protein
MKTDQLNLNGKQVHAFTIQIGNLGFSQMTDLIMSMFNSNVWREFTDGLGAYKFLPGEFDYFLTQRGVKREDIIHGIRDIEVKAKLDKAMDEGRTGEDDYRRRIEQARNENPTVPGRPIMPFGLTKNEAKYLKLKDAAAGRTEALGHRVRYFANHRKKKSSLPLLDRLIHSAVKLNDRDLDKLIESLKREQAARNNSKIVKLRVAK